MPQSKKKSKIFAVGQFMKQRKILQEELVERNNSLDACRNEINIRKRELETARLELSSVTSQVIKTRALVRKDEIKLGRMKSKADSLVKEIEEVGEIIDELNGPPKKKAKYLPSKAVDARSRNPTTFDDGRIKLSTDTRRRRNAETYGAAVEIHGGRDGAVIGLLDAVDKKGNPKLIKKVISGSKKLSKKVIPSIYKEKAKLFESSDVNMIRSIATYYSAGVMGKKKYRAVYKASCYGKKKEKKRGKTKSLRITVSDCPVPRLVPYNKLMPYVKSIDIGKLYSVRETLCYGMEEDQKVDGCFRDIKELLPRLVKFYLDTGIYDLNYFNNESHTFHVTIGGDGAPFGKDDTSFAWLCGFLNIGKGILSSNENFLVFGANCSETSTPVVRFVKNILVDIKFMESHSFSVDCESGTVNAKFVFSELPNDMKMLAFLSGELTNSAKYFSSFADVSENDLTNASGTFGSQHGNTWKPWNYKRRLDVVKEVESLKKKLEKQKLAPTTKRGKITAFIAEKKSRQEFVPLLEEIIDRAHIEPLHLKNNACALAHRMLLNKVIEYSKLTYSFSSYSQVTRSCPLFKYIDALKKKCHLKRLAKKIVSWFNETKGTGKNFDYRFTGKDSRLFVHNFMYLIEVAEACCENMRQTTTIHKLAYLCLCLRDAVSIFSRVNITTDEVTELKDLSARYYRAFALFFQPNQTAWHLGNIVPVHAEQMFAKYGFGLGLNSMEGREAKHVFIAKYSKNTVYDNRWEQVFCHEYISLIWLRERGYNITKVSRSGENYIPKRVQKPSFCYCGYPKNEDDSKCRFCLHELRRKIEVSVEKCKVML